MVGGVGSLSEYRRSVGAVHSIGWHSVWCPKYRKGVLVGPVADRLRELLVAKAAERAWSVEALELMPDHVHLFVRTPPDETTRFTKGKP
jgi:putative transposase